MERRTREATLKAEEVARVARESAVILMAQQAHDSLRAHVRARYGDDRERKRKYATNQRWLNNLGRIGFHHPGWMTFLAFMGAVFIVGGISTWPKDAWLAFAGAAAVLVIGALFARQGYVEVRLKQIHSQNASLVAQIGCGDRGCKICSYPGGEAAWS